VDEMAQVAVSSYEGILGEPFDAAQFNDKLTMQKIIYLMRELGVDCGCRFVWHTYGPYSQSLQTKLNQMRNGADITAPELTDKAKVAMNKLKGALNRPQGTYSVFKWIETLGSAHYLKRYIHPAYGREEIVDELMRRKPYLSDRRANELAWDQLAELGLI